MYKEASAQHLIPLLQAAYSGELAAALAYQGHAQSLNDPQERCRVLKIESEEWMHRYALGLMLTSLNAKSSFLREWKASILGHLLGFGCRWLGWFAPMYLAGFLESKNIMEYKIAAQIALQTSHAEFLPFLLEMARVEWEHEQFFRSKILSHRFSRWLPIWKEPRNLRYEFD